MESVQFKTISQWVATLPVESSLQKLAINSLEEKLYSKYCKLSSRVAMCSEGQNCVSAWKEGKAKQIERFSKLVQDVSASEKQDFALISMVVDRLDTL